MHAYSQCVSHNLSLSLHFFSCVCDQRERGKRNKRRRRKRKEKKKGRRRKCPCSSSFVKEKEVIGTVFHHSVFPLIGPKGHSPIRHMDTQHTHFLSHSSFFLFPFFFFFPLILLPCFLPPSSSSHSITFVQMCELCLCAHFLDTVQEQSHNKLAHSLKVSQLEGVSARKCLRCHQGQRVENE